jgi:hypothetical protein
MAVTLEAVNQREKGQFPISIATSLALEGACGVHPDHPESPAPFTSPPQELWINTRTLFRNVMGAMNAETRAMVLPAQLHAVLVEELSIIEAAVIHHTQGNTIVVFYACDYSGMERKYPKASLKQAKTPNQHMYLGLEQQTLRLLMKEHGSQDLRHFPLELTGKHGHTWIITHLPLDLLSKSYFASLKLLESHTGVLKGPSLWYTKLTGGNELPNIPFGAFGLQAFGDGGHQFNAQPRVIKEEILRLAEQYKWNATTTKDRMLLSLREVKDPMTRTFLLALL